MVRYVRVEVRLPSEPVVQAGLLNHLEDPGPGSFRVEACDERSRFVIWSSASALLEPFFFPSECFQDFVWHVPRALGGRVQ